MAVLPSGYDHHHTAAIMNETTLTLLAALAVSYLILYVIIRKAVCAGILDAHRQREFAEAERQRVIAERRRSDA